MGDDVDVCEYCGARLDPKAPRWKDESCPPAEAWAKDEDGSTYHLLCVPGVSDG